MARTSRVEDLDTLQMALLGYEVEKRKIEDKISELQARLKGKQTAAGASSPSKSTNSRKRNLSPEARRRIALAQKKRWAEHRKRAAIAAKTAG